MVNNKDIIFKGEDGGSGVTALTLDMSDAGSAIFNNNVGIGGTPADPQGFGRALHIEGGTNAAIYLRDTGNANYGYIGFIGGATNKMSVNSYQGYLSLTTGAGNEAVRISETGVTTIGMTNATGSSTVRIGSVGNAGANGTGNLEFVNSNSYKSWKVSAGGTPTGALAFTQSGTNGDDDWSTERMRITAEGKVLIGTAEAATIGKAIVMSMVFG